MRGKWEVISERARCSSARFVPPVVTARCMVPPRRLWLQFRAGVKCSSLALLIAVPSLPEVVLFHLSELEGMTSESRRLEHMVTERFPLLSSPVVLLCGGEKMKGWKITRGKVWTFSCWAATHFVEKYCQMLFVVVFHLQSHSFSEGFSFDWLKSIDGKFTWFPAEPPAAFQLWPW